MTPAELITRKMKAALEASGVTLPVDSLLLEALAGEKHASKASSIVLNVHVAEQLHEPLPMYSFSAIVALTVSLDDDKGGGLFVENYDAIWAELKRLSLSDNCTALGDEGDETETHIFAVDGFQLGEGDPPDFAEDENGGTWTTTFAATITGRAS